MEAGARKTQHASSLEPPSESEGSRREINTLQRGDDSRGLLRVDKIPILILKKA